LHGIGVFNVETIPAASERLGRDFLPPQFRIVFVQRDEQSNRLQQLIADEYGIAQHEAEQQVAGFVSAIVSVLNAGGIYIINGIGKLSKPENDKIVFEADNQNALAFGLSGFSANIVSLQQPEIIAAKPARKRRRIPVLLVLLLLIIAAGITAWFVFPEKVEPLWDEVTSLFDSGSESNNTTTSTDTLSNTTDTTGVAVVDTLNSDSTDAETTTNTEVEVANASFFVIGGSFATQSDAEEFYNKLKQRGFPAEIVQSPTEGRIRVAYKSFDSKPDALDYLNKIRVSENKPDIWLYTKK
jgi:hypothetical protein